MQKILCAGLLGFAIISNAQAGLIQSFSSEGAYLAALDGLYTETYEAFAAFDTPSNFSSDGFTYTGTGDNSTLFVDNDGAGGTGLVLQTFVAADSIEFSFTSGNINAVGGYFWSANFNQVVDPAGIIDLLFSDGTSETLSSPTFDTFRGYIFDAPVTSLRITPTSGGDNSATINDFTVGSAAVSVPAPSTLALFGLGLAGLGWKSRKKA